MSTSEETVSARSRFPSRSMWRTLDLVDVAQIPSLSRVELEHVLLRDVEIGDETSADAIRTELASRPWQGVNPYASVPVTSLVAAAPDDRSADDESDPES